MIKKLKTIFVATLFLVMCAFSVQGAIHLSLDSPTDNSWVTSNSVDFKFTPYADVTNIPWCSIWINESGTSWSMRANYTNVPNGTSFSRGIALSDSNGLEYVWNAQCYNGSGTPFTNGTNLTFGVDANPPIVSLSLPVDGTYQNSTSVVFDYIPTDSSNPDTCELWTNITGVWAVNETNGSFTSGQLIEVTNVVSAGTYIFNVLCNDSAGQETLAELSGNSTLVVDTTSPTYPAIIFPANNSFSSDSTPYIVWNVSTETNFQKYTVTVSKSINMSSPIQVVYISNRSINYTTLTTLVGEQAFYVQVRASDLSGNGADSTPIRYNLDGSSPTVTISSPSDESYTSDTTPQFNVTVIDSNPDACSLWLGVVNGASNTTVRNVTVTGITNATLINISASDALAEGSYFWTIECNDSDSNVVNGSSSLWNLTVDSTSPTAPNISSTWHLINGSDSTPELSWLQANDSFFSYYEAKAFNYATGVLEYAINVTTQATTYVSMILTPGAMYNFSVVAYDLAGNSNVDANSSAQTTYYVDPICGTLYTGWNVCGATWVASRNLSQIGYETSAQFVSVWNSSHQWTTCNHGNSLVHCEETVGINVDDYHAVWIYVNETQVWRNRSWIATAAYTNFTLENASNGVGWNLESGLWPQGQLFGDLGRDFMQTNVSMFSMRYNENGSSIPYVNTGLFATLQNGTTWDYGRAMWIYFNGTGSHTFVPGGW